MKCGSCGYEESVPYWVLDEMSDGNRKDGFTMCCPRCDKEMVEKKNYNKSNKG